MQLQGPWKSLKSPRISVPKYSGSPGTSIKQVERILRLISCDVSLMIRHCKSIWV